MYKNKDFNNDHLCKKALSCIFMAESDSFFYLEALHKPVKCREGFVTILHYWVSCGCLRLVEVTKLKMKAKDVNVNTVQSIGNAFVSISSFYTKMHVCGYLW